MKRPSIPEYVNSLEYDQLTTLIKHASAAKEAKDNESKKILFQVMAWDGTWEFRDNEFHLAIEFLHKKLNEIAELDLINNEDLIRDRLRETRLITIKEFSSDYEKWFR